MVTTNGDDKAENEVQDQQLLPAAQGQRPAAKVQPPLMPLIDVMFTLMLFFLVAAHVRDSEGMIPANLPNLGPGRWNEFVPPEPIDVRLLPAGVNREGVSIQVERTVVADGGALYRQLLGLQRQWGNDRMVRIVPSPQVRWEHVVNAFNQAVRANFSQVGFAPSQV